MAFWISFVYKSSWIVAVLTCRRFGCIQNGDKLKTANTPTCTVLVCRCLEFVAILTCRCFGFVAVLDTTKTATCTVLDTSQHSVLDKLDCRSLDVSLFWICRRFGSIQNGDTPKRRYAPSWLSPFWFVAILACRRFGLSPFWICRRFGFVAVFTCIR